MAFNPQKTIVFFRHLNGEPQSSHELPELKHMPPWSDARFKHSMKATAKFNQQAHDYKSYATGTGTFIINTGTSGQSFNITTVPRRQYRMESEHRYTYRALESCIENCMLIFGTILRAHLPTQCLLHEPIYLKLAIATA